MKYKEKESPFVSDKNAVRIFLVRHGQSLGNLDNRYLGHTDLDLSPLGYEQASKCADFMSDEHIDDIYSSDLIRAYHTGLAHAQLRGIECTPLRELREIYLGEWEGVSRDYLVREQAELFNEGWHKNFGTFTPPGGESTAHLGIRIYNEIKRICNMSAGKTILVAIHAAAIRTFWGKICGVKNEDLAEVVQFPTNASVSTVYYKDGRFYPIEYSADSFLK